VTSNWIVSMQAASQNPLCSFPALQQIPHQTDISAQHSQIQLKFPIPKKKQNKLQTSK
jgi:hypothetical protein